MNTHNLLYGYMLSLEVYTLTKTKQQPYEVEFQHAFQIGSRCFNITF